MTTANPLDIQQAAGASSNPRSDERRGSITDLAALFAIESLLRSANEQTISYCQASSGIASRHRAEIEGLSEWLRRFEANLREARNHVETLGVALDRIKIVALNTGLEGARLGDLAGKALIAVSDELRNLTSRGLELLSEQAGAVEQMEVDRQRLVELSDRSQAQMIEIESRLREALASEQAESRTLDRLTTALAQATGLDAEAAARLGRISEQARALAETLASLPKLEQGDLVRSALMPALQPLLSWVSSSVDTKP